MCDAKSIMYITSIKKYKACEFFLHQYITEATRGKNTLDLFAANDSLFISRAEVLSKSKISDHNLIVIHTTQYMEPNKQTLEKESPLSSLCYWSKIINWESINSKFASYNWEELFHDKSPDEIYQKICSVITEVAEENIPKRKNQVRQIPKDRKILMRRRNKLHNIALIEV